MNRERNRIDSSQGVNCLGPGREKVYVYKRVGRERGIWKVKVALDTGSSVHYLIVLFLIFFSFFFQFQS